MPEPSLVDKVLQVDATLRRARIAHAFGGALALAYYAEPRATNDIDVNVFVAPARYGAVIARLEPLGIERVPPSEQAERDGQARVWWGRNPVDLFFAYDPLHDAMQQSMRRVPFGEAEIPILAPEHLLVAKVVFDRAKDWLDIEQMLLSVPAIDVDEAVRWLTHLVGTGDGRFVRFRTSTCRLLGR